MDVHDGSAPTHWWNIYNTAPPSGGNHKHDYQVWKKTFSLSKKLNNYFLDLYASLNTL